jgi:hypothetical protein
MHVRPQGRHAHRRRSKWFPSVRGFIEGAGYLIHLNLADRPKEQVKSGTLRVEATKRAQKLRQFQFLASSSSVADVVQLTVLEDGPLTLQPSEGAQPNRHASFS